MITKAKAACKAWIAGLGTLSALAGLASCGPKRLYEQGYPLTNHVWVADSVLTFAVQIDKPTQAYDLFYRVRYDLDYPFYNLYVRLQIQDSAAANVYQDRHELVLVDAQTGKPAGAGIGGVFEKEFTALSKMHFTKKGLYKIRIKQYMRPITLQGVHEFGVRISPSV